jgi:NAD-dependent DNA ligase
MTDAHFIYRDAEGHVTVRTVTDAVESGSYLQGYCSESGGYRTFRRDRILEFLSPESDIQARLENQKFLSPVPVQREKRIIVRNDNDALEVCFTGFEDCEKSRFIEIAKENGLFVRTSVSVGLNILCCGSTPGPAKIKKARTQGALILSSQQFLKLIETGEIPEG